MSFRVSLYYFPVHSNYLLEDDLTKLFFTNYRSHILDLANMDLGE